MNDFTFRVHEFIVLAFDHTKHNIFHITNIAFPLFCSIFWMKFYRLIFSGWLYVIVLFKSLLIFCFGCLKKNCEEEQNIYTLYFVFDFSSVFFLKNVSQNWQKWKYKLILVWFSSNGIADQNWGYRNSIGGVCSGGDNTKNDKWFVVLYFAYSTTRCSINLNQIQSQNDRKIK